MKAKANYASIFTRSVIEIDTKLVNNIQSSLEEPIWSGKQIAVRYPCSLWHILPNRTQEVRLPTIHLDLSRGHEGTRRDSRDTTHMRPRNRSTLICDLLPVFIISVVILNSNSYPCRHWNIQLFFDYTSFRDVTFYLLLVRGLCRLCFEK